MIFADASEDLHDVGKSIEIINTNNEILLSGLHTIFASRIVDVLIVGFGGHLFQCQTVRDQIKNEAQGTKVLGISVGRMSKIDIPLPQSTTEQQKIADCLTSLDVLIRAENRKLDLLKTHKKALMQQLFPRDGETVPTLRFPEFREVGEWEIVALGSTTLKVGSGITPKGGESNYLMKGRPFIRSQNIGWGQLLLSDVVYIDDKTHEKFSSSEIQFGDVLLNITGASIGRCSIASTKIEGGNVNQHVCIIRTRWNELHPYFLMQYLVSKCGQKQINNFQAGGNRQGLNFAQVRSFLIPLASNLDEQLQISNCLLLLDKLITAQTRKLDALKAHKKALMQQLFPVLDDGAA